jgi:hypothetical protein
MDLPFTHKPGRRERHLRRRHENPLFAWPPAEVPPEDLLAAQRADHEEMEAFRDSLRALVQRAVDLPPDSGSEQIISLKEALEQHYELACGLPENHDDAKAAIKRLITVIMRTLWRQAGTDPLAQQELSDEEAAREIHFRLLEQPLVADLLHPESPIRPEELIPALLCGSPAEAAAVRELFDPPHIAQLVDAGETLCARLTGLGVAVDRPRANLAILRGQFPSAGTPVAH